MLDPRMSRRAVLAGMGAIAAVSSASADQKIEALAFDGFPIFDPRPIAAQVRRLFPARGDALAAAWSNKLFADTWLVTSADTYLDFSTLAAAALRFAADSLHLPLADDECLRLVDAYAHLDVWPDVKPALEKLKGAGVRLAVLSNLGEATLRADMGNAGIAEHFEAVLSTDKVRRFKPAPIAYRMAVDHFGLPVSRIGFVAFGGWDAVGATWFGYRTAWINRLGAPDEHLGARPAIVTSGIEGALQLAGLG